MMLDTLKKVKNQFIGVRTVASALAEAEVEYKDKTSKSIDVSFEADKESISKLKDIFNTNKPQSISFVIWTTTPWTIPSNVAVCINAELDYSLINVDESYLVIASEMIDECMERWGKDGTEISKALVN